MNLGKSNLGFRAWFYFRQGWSTYFAFLFAAINTMIVTYYLAIENISTLKDIFPTFWSYLLVVAVIGVPLLITIGYIHYKKVAAFHAEADITQESQPFNYKLLPGHSIEVTFPLMLLVSEWMVKISNDEKLSENEIKEIRKLQKKIQLLTKGGYVGNPPVTSGLIGKESDQKESDQKESDQKESDQKETDQKETDQKETDQKETDVI